MRAHTHAHTHTHTPPHTIHKLFLDFREIEKNCTEIEKLLVSERWGCEYIGTFDSEIKCSQSLNQIQTLKDCLIYHVCCVHLGTPWYRAVTAFCAVFYRESRYTHTHYGCDLESLRVYFFVVSVSRQEAQRWSFALPFGEWHSRMVWESLHVCHSP